MAVLFSIRTFSGLTKRRVVSLHIVPNNYEDLGSVHEEYVPIYNNYTSYTIELINTRPEIGSIVVVTCTSEYNFSCE